MTPEQTKDLVTDLLKRVGALEQYVQERKQNQLTYPLDYASQQIISSL